MLVYRPKQFEEKLRSYARYIRLDEKNAVQTYNHLAYDLLMSIDWSYDEARYHEALGVISKVRQERFEEDSL